MRTAVVLAAVLTSAVSCGAPTASTSPSPAPQVSASPSDAITGPTPIPRTTPPGTPGPIPTAGVAGSASITPPPPRENATPSPTPDPAVWRIEGYVVDEAGKPLESVCVVLGPAGCQLWSPKTDDRGYYFIDVAAGSKTVFDIYFEMPGRRTVWWKAIPEGPTQFNVILKTG